MHNNLTRATTAALAIGITVSVSYAASAHSDGSRRHHSNATASSSPTGTKRPHVRGTAPATSTTGAPTPATSTTGAPTPATSTTGAPVPASANNATSWPAQYAAPYIQSGEATDLAATSARTGLRYFTLAFLIGDGCDLHWGSGHALDSNVIKDSVNGLRAKGGDVSISVGGAAGTDPATSCTNAADLQAQYQRIIDVYGVSHLDLDIEGEAKVTPEVVARRNTAVAGLKRSNPSLQVSYTVPSTYTGLRKVDLDQLADAEKRGAHVDVVNLMTMDYDETIADMGRTSINAAEGLVKQLATIHPDRSEAERRSMVGITPMIGQNDSAGEVFSLADAQAVVDHARNNGMREVSFWAVGRDNGTCAGSTVASSRCSGIAQSESAFSHIFASFTK